MRKKTLIYFVILIGILAFSCDVDTFTPEDYSGFSDQEMNTFSSILNLPQQPDAYGSNSANAGLDVNYKGSMGRVLFYDTNLSADGNISCASCHHQELAFGDNNAFSEGVHGNLTQRNSIALGSLRSFGNHYQNEDLRDKETPGLFWDERASTIKEQLEQTISNPDEMGMDIKDIVDYVSEVEFYQILNKKAFGNEVLTADNLLEALEVFISSINSPLTSFEANFQNNLNYITGDSIVDNSEHNRGFELFKQNCSTCHSNTVSIEGHENEKTIFNANNGLKLNGDLGIYESTSRTEDIGKFKIPGLFNVALSAPYMHDGRFQTLEEVVEFYNSQIELSDNLHPALTKNDQAKRMNLTESDKAALVEFLHSLTDQKLQKEAKWSNPFL